MREIPEVLQTSDGVLQVATVVGLELSAVICIPALAYVVIALAIKRVRLAITREAVHRRLHSLSRLTRRLWFLLTTMGILAVLGWNGYLLWINKDPYTYTIEQLREIPRSFWLNLLTGLAQAIGLLIAGVLVKRFIKSAVDWLNARMIALAPSEDHHVVVNGFCSGLRGALTNCMWLLVLILSAQALLLPSSAINVLISIVGIYLTVAVGLLIVRMTSLIVASLDAVSANVAAQRSWQRYYDHLRPLIPLLRRCLEAVVWVSIATVVMWQIGPLIWIGDYGPRLIQAIGVFFLGRVGIECGRLFIDHALAPDPKMTDLERRRRETIVPLFKTVFSALAYFVVGVLILAAFNQPVMPFLAGAGIMGMVIGLGAQPLINDVMSGFFILIEQAYLVDDFVEVNGARGTIESIDFRTTRLRDVDGRLHVIRNGEMRHIINASKEFTYAVVELELPYDANIQLALQLLKDTGEQLREENTDVVAPAEVRGITEFDDWGMKVRTVVKVHPACHASVAAHYRLLILTAFRQHDIHMAIPRQRVHLESEGNGKSAD